MKSIISSTLLFISLILVSLHQISWAKNITLYTGSPYHIDQNHILYFNISTMPEGIIAAQIDLNQIFPNINTNVLKGKNYDFNNNQIEIISYQGLPIVINYSINTKNKNIENSTSFSMSKGHKNSLSKPINIKSHPISMEKLNHFEQIFYKDTPHLLKKNLADEPYLINIFMFHAAINDFDDMNDFFQNAIKNLTKKNDIDNYEKAKNLYLEYLNFGENNEFYDTTLIMAAIEHTDISFIKKMKLRKINELVVDEVEPQTYYFTRCSPLGKAIRLNQYQIISYLLEKGASTEIVCISKFNEEQSALALAEQYKNKKVIKLINSTLKPK
ncbi:hypothetical protein [Acinetobacter sp. YH12023]|uniref:hypothetical protein n=1 Tax=Acinetobacter sp. YH12023 TaxID=2601041 RepID=UPI001C55162F|nr:hypothetical protein [Acinetobacter sp. YH12023]